MTTAYHVNDQLAASGWITPYGWDSGHEADLWENGTRVANAMTWENRSRRPVLIGVARARRISR